MTEKDVKDMLHRIREMKITPIEVYLVQTFQSGSFFITEQDGVIGILVEVDQAKKEDILRAIK